MRSRLDAVIVGGGPAGALCAIHLARLGWSVALIERGPRFRNKCCGHCLSPRACGLLRRAGVLTAVQQIASGKTSLLRVHSQQQSHLEIDFGIDEESCGLVVERSRLDQALVDAAATSGALVVQPASARVVERGLGASVVEVCGNENRLHFETPLVIGADGVGSGTARSAGWIDCGAVGRKFAVAFDVEVAGESSIDVGAIEMFLADGGYLGAARSGEDRIHIAALVCGQHPWPFVRRAATKHTLLRMCGIDQLSREDVTHFAAVGPMPWRPQRIADGNIALIGDAAGYVEPFTGEGMTWAIHSAEVLADMLAHVRPGVWNSDLAARYQQSWRMVIHRQQRMCRMLAIGLERNWIVPWMMRGANLFPSIAQHLARKAIAA